jgi:hypothetical protein
MAWQTLRLYRPNHGRVTTITCSRPANCLALSPCPYRPSILVWTKYVTTSLSTIGQPHVPHHLAVLRDGQWETTLFYTMYVMMSCLHQLQFVRIYMLLGFIPDGVTFQIFL